MAEKINPFEFVDSASNTKVDLIGSGHAAERDYVSYLANRALSYHSDAILYVNEMNFWRDLDRRLQYDYLRLSLRKRSRRSKWSKPDDLEAVELVAWRYGLSPKKAREALSILTDDHVQKIRIMKEQTHG